MSFDIGFCPNCCNHNRLKKDCNPNIHKINRGPGILTKPAIRNSPPRLFTKESPRRCYSSPCTGSGSSGPCSLPGCGISSWSSMVRPLLKYIKASQRLVKKLYTLINKSASKKTGSRRSLFILLMLANNHFCGA